MGSASRIQQALIQAVLNLWDETIEHANSIARLLNSGALLETHAESRALKTRKQNGNRR